MNCLRLWVNTVVALSFSAFSLANAVAAEDTKAKMTTTFGRGANAPAWEGSAPVFDESFERDIPIHPAAANANGFLGWFGSRPWDSSRISYPAVQSTGGNGRALQILFRKGDDGGAAPVRMAAGSWKTATKVYTRVLVKMDPAWDNNGNTETKFFFMRGPKDGEQNHYCSPGPDARITLQLGGGTMNLPSIPGSMPFGVWHDMEMVLISNTPGTPTESPKCGSMGNR